MIQTLPPFLPDALPRVCPPPLADLFHTARSTVSDINEHLDLLRLLASQVERVTEFGMRGGMSTIALLAGQPSSLISWDINPKAVVSNMSATLLHVAESGRCAFQPRVGDTLKISAIEPTDMLFIDSLHTAQQLKAELERHVDPLEMRVKKYLVFHDTVTFGEQGEDNTVPGLRAVIRWFQKNHAFPQWKLVVDRPNNNGLAVLEATG